MPFAFALLFLGLQNPSQLNVPIVLSTTTPQDRWMSALAECESMGSTTIKVWDTNNQWSIGKYQYQYKTWMKYSKQFGTTKENITDGDLQDKVTRYVLDNGGEDNWFNCSRTVRKTLGTYPRDSSLSSY